MKFLLINSVCGIGSTGRICTDIATVLDERGHEVKIAYGRNDPVPEKYRKYAVRIGNKKDVLFHGIKSRLMDDSGFGSTQVTKDFVEWIKAYDPDIIHLHNVHGYYINVEILFEYLKSSGKKILWTLHDCWPFTGHSATCESIGCEKWKTGCVHCLQKRDYPKSFINRSEKNWIRKKSSFQGVPNLQIITPSHWLERMVKESFLNVYPVQVIHNGIDRSQFFFQKNGFRREHHLEGQMVVLGVANIWTDLKGYSDFLAIARRLGKDDSIKFVMVGLSKNQIKELPSNVIGIQRTNSRKELAGIYSSSDLFLNLTYSDTYPTVNLEAIACGTPILTYDVGGSTEIANKFNGIVIQKGNIDQLEKKIKDCQKNGIALNITKEMLQELDHANAIQLYLDCYLQ